MTTTMQDLQTGRSYLFSEALPGRDAYEEALALGFTGTRAEWLASLRGFAFDPLEPDWAVDHEYAPHAAVRHAHKLWVCKVVDTGTEPGTDPDVWMLLLDGSDAQALLDAVAAALGHKQGAATAQGAAEAAQTGAAALLALTQAAAQALSPIEVLRPVSVPVPAGWWDTGDRLLAGMAERAILCNWQPESHLPAALWMPTRQAPVFDAPSGGSEADPSDGIGRIDDQSGNGYDLTQSSATLRPVVHVDAEDVQWARFGPDDRLDAAITPGLAGQVLVAGRGGLIVADMTIAAAGQFQIGNVNGGYTWTGAVPGLLRAVGGDGGDPDILGIVARDGVIDADEIAWWERYTLARGGQALLETGSEVSPNVVFDDVDTWWVTGVDHVWTPGLVTKSGTVGRGQLYSASVLEPDTDYMISIDVDAISGAVQTRTGDGSDQTTHGPNILTTGTHTRVVRTGATHDRVYVMTSNDATTYAVSRFSIQKLSPREVA